MLLVMLHNMSDFDKTLQALSFLSGKSNEEQLQLIEEQCSISRPYTLEGVATLGKVTRVVDGDSFYASIPIDGYGYMWTFPFRLDGVDCPEVRTKNLREKELGFKAKSHVENLVMDKIVCLKLGKFDKFGRLLSSIITNDGINVGDDLIENELARPYNGGKMLDW